MLKFPLPQSVLWRAWRGQRPFRCASLAIALALAWPAQADVWGYVDDRGVAHFAAEKLDDRFELFFKGGTSFDTRDGLVTQLKLETDAARLAIAPAKRSKLFAFFDVSANFKAVKHHMRGAAQAQGIDFELLQALIATESGFDTNAVSPKGAVGLMQLMPPTAQRYGVSGDTNETVSKRLKDPKTNINAGARYLRDLINMFPDRLDLALAAYNAGEGAVARFGNTIPPYKETQNYVTTVMQIYYQLKPPEHVVQRSVPARVRIELGVPGQIAGRANMVAPLTSASPALNPRH